MGAVSSCLTECAPDANYHAPGCLQRDTPRCRCGHVHDGPAGICGALKAPGRMCGCVAFVAADARTSRTLADALLVEMTRVRDDVMPAYIEIGAAGDLALALMRQSLDAAARALAEHDGVACLGLLGVLRGYNT